MNHPLTQQLEDKTFSVKEYLELINELLNPVRVSVEGEITDLKTLPQWVFFSLKDSESGEVLRCGLHSGQYRRVGVTLEEGMTVKVFGHGKISPRTGNFGFWVTKIEPIGEGALKRAYELLVKKLDTEGLFTRKRELPKFISHIGVISSRNGVVVQDLMKNLKSLGIRVDFIHSGVEGADSAHEILKGVEHFNATQDTPDVLVLIRGGGSLESLQGFNNEAVVRALHASPVPVLVGIGHDVDAPIATMVADWSASTPTAVAHVINESWSPLTEQMPEYARMMHERFAYRLQEIEREANSTMKTIRYGMSRLLLHFDTYKKTITRSLQTIGTQITRQREQVSTLSKEVRNTMHKQLTQKQQQVIDYERLLSASDPERILSRGFGLVYTAEGRLVRTLDDIQEGEIVKTRLQKGVFESEVREKKY